MYATKITGGAAALRFRLLRAGATMPGGGFVVVGIGIGVGRSNDHLTSCAARSYRRLRAGASTSVSGRTASAAAPAPAARTTTISRGGGSMWNREKSPRDPPLRRSWPSASARPHRSSGGGAIIAAAAQIRGCSTAAGGFFATRRRRARMDSGSFGPRRLDGREDERSNPRNGSRRRALSSSATRGKNGQPPALYEVARISADGSVSVTSLPVPEILRGSSMHARDLFSLALTSRHELGRKRLGSAASVRRPPSVILPRGDEVVVSFGNVRALIGRDSGMIFDAHRPSIQLLAVELSETFDSKAREAQEYSTGENLIVDEDYRVKMKYIGEPFELVFIEEVLRDTCDTYNRRLRVFEPIVDTFMSRTTNEVFSDSGVQKLVPIKDSLQEFELNVKQCLECLTHLLGNDEDMLGLLLTEQARAARRGEDLRHEMHEAVELLFEEYARQLSNILHEIRYLQRRVQSKQELVALSLDAYRNRMLRMNVYLSIAGLGLAAGTTVAGFYGMNLINGLEDSPVAFNNVVMSTSLVGVVLFAGCASYLSGSSMKKRAAMRLEEIETISGALSDMASLDYTIKIMVEEGKPMNKEQFARHLLESSHSSDANDKEVDLLFDVLDVSRDGRLHTEDFRSMESFGHAPARQCKISPQAAKKGLVSDA